MQTITIRLYGEHAARRHVANVLKCANVGAGRAIAVKRDGSKSHTLTLAFDIGLIADNGIDTAIVQALSACEPAALSLVNYRLIGS